jgi:hypothetical protein
MLRTVALFAWLAILCGPGLAQRSEEPRIEVKMDRTRVYEGESVGYTVSIMNVEKATPPTLEGFDDFEVQFQNQRSLNSSFISNVNGRLSRVNRFGTEYLYRLMPLRTGTLDIPAPTVEVDGVTLKGRALTLKVVGPEVQGEVILEIESSPRSVYPLQSFTVTLKAWVKALPSPYTEQSPLSVQRNVPMLTLPWVDNLPEDLVPETDSQKWLGSLTSRTFGQRSAGFGINNISSSFSLFSEEMISFQLPHKRTVRPDHEGAAQDYWEYTLERSFKAQRPGTYRFGPASLKGTFATGREGRDRLKGEEIYAVARAIEVEVKDVPLEGRPDSFTGAIGEFEFEASLRPDHARVGDPMTLVLKLKGKGTLDRARAPDLEAIPEIANRFKVYEATEETQGLARTFTYSLRPMSAEIETFPAVPLSYFDVGRERYVTLRTDPIPVRIEAADQLAGEDIIIQPAAGDRNGQKAIEARKEGIFANIMDPSALRDESVDYRIHGAALGGMAVFYFLAAFATRRIRKVSGDQALRRRRSARSRARTRIDEAASRLEAGDLKQGVDLIRSALTGLVADAADLPEAGLTVRDVKEHLLRLEIEAELVARIETLMESCDAACYGALADQGGGLAQQSKELLAALLTALQKMGRLK